MLIGVDEAGRGPVLGSMFVAAIAVPDEHILPNGIVDSKQLTAEHREEFAAEFRDDPAILTAVIEVSVSAIDAPEHDLNTLTARAHRDAIREVLSADAVAECMVDACDVNPERFRTRVASDLPSRVSVDARHRADEDDPLVAAASIVAKSHREAHVEELASSFGSVGSGYPSDPVTRDFLEDFVRRHGSLPSCARHSWQTSTDVLAAVEQGSLADFGD